MGTALYVRISEDKTGLEAGIQRQTREAEEMCARRDLTIDYRFADNDISAYNGKRRPEFEELLRMVEVGVVDTIVVWHPDRLYRRSKDLERVIDAVEAHKPRILSVMAGEFDLNSATGRATARTIVAWSTHESEHKIDRQRSSARDRALHGYWHFSHRPFGFERVDGKVVQVPDEIEVLRDALFDYYEGGTSRHAIMRELNARGILTPQGKEWGIIQVRDMLRNGHYGGVVSYRDEVFEVEPQWQPVVDRETWARWMSRAAKMKRKSTFTAAAHLLSGILVCAECGGKVYTATNRGSLAYRCKERSCAQRKVEPVDDFVLRLVRGRLAMPDAAEVFRPATPSTEGIIDELADIQTRQGELAELLAEGTLTAGAVREAASKLNTRAEALRARLDAARTSTDLPSLEDALERWDALELPAKRATVRILFKRLAITRANGKKTFTPDALEVEWA